ncbi:hypothetical protein DEM26_08905 [Thioclava sp. NG1]|uniref:LexA family transcriptional regulator n=1 Tax=Thioclava sp. NG1 TaxID=2182426 RepID=UPI000D60B581|nr:LexA family transcriptional regulator [Thioclava sp. NG1]PWE50059.1 hypothetical protein DEM26_08905 [Thioclava sp. NG1]
MDDKWFKQQQKRVGVTAEDIARHLGRDRSVVSKIYTGQRSMTLDFARKFAEVLDVPLAEVLERAGVGTGVELKSMAPGISEGDAVPWSPKENDRRRTPTIAEAFGASAGVDIWRVQTGSMALQGYMPGDYMLVDTHQAERAKNGDVVVAQIFDNAKNRAVTVLRRLETPVLVAASMEPGDRRVHVVDGINVVVRGKVIASWRMGDEARKLSEDEVRAINQSAHGIKSTGPIRPKLTTRRKIDTDIWIAGGSSEDQ